MRDKLRTTILILMLSSVSFSGAVAQDDDASSHTSPQSKQASQAATPQFQEVIYGHKDGLALTMDVLEPHVEPNGAAVVFMVSGGWFSKWVPPWQTRATLAPYLDAGYKVFAARHGSAPRYSIAEAVADVRRAVRTIRRSARKYSIDPDRIGVAGMSAGGHLTLMLATTGDDGDPQAEDPIARISSRIAAGTALVPPSDITNYVWGTPNLDDQYRRYPGLDISKKAAKEVSPLYFVTPDDAPCLMIMGGKDTLVPAEQGQWIHDKMKSTGVASKLIVYPDSGHGLDGNMPKAFEESLAWFEKHLK
ncbi:MAG: hypothetical protein Aurels2KO_09520 [Aureliella sp.]